MKIENTKVYGIEESLVRAGYPMQTEIIMPTIPNIKDLKRGCTLGNALPGSGHDKFLRGIIVQFDLIAPRYFWQEFDTYHFVETVSSQSTMHCITKFHLYRMFNDEYISPVIYREFDRIVQEYKDNPTEENLLRVKHNLPEGLHLGRGISTNYAQLKTIYLQRNNHRLPEWRDVFCPWVLTLPRFNQLCLGGNNENQI